MVSNIVSPPFTVHYNVHCTLYTHALYVLHNVFYTVHCTIGFTLLHSKAVYVILQALRQLVPEAQNTLNFTTIPSHYDIYSPENVTLSYILLPVKRGIYEKRRPRTIYVASVDLAQQNSQKISQIFPQEYLHSSP